MNLLAFFLKLLFQGSCFLLQFLDLVLLTGALLNNVLVDPNPLITSPMYLVSQIPKYCYTFLLSDLRKLLS